MIASTPPDPIAPTLRLPGTYDAVWHAVAPITFQNRESKAHYITQLILSAYESLRPHQAPASVADLGAESISSVQLSEHLGWRKDKKTGLAKYQSFILPFFDFPTANAGYNHAAHETKRYQLKDSAAQLVDADLMSDEPALVVDRESEKQLTTADFPKNGVYRTSYSSIIVPSIVPVQVDLLDAKISEAEQIVKTSTIFKLQRERRHLRSLRLVRKWVTTLGGLPNLYSDFKEADPEAGHGRLYGAGTGHLQSMRGKTRRAVLGGAGLWDYDFRSSNFAIMESLAAYAGVDTGAVGEYRANKDAVHQRLMTLLDLPEYNIKQSFLTMIYGGHPTPNPKATLYHLLGGRENTIAFRDDEFIKKFRIDLVETADAILATQQLANANAYTANGVYNVVGKFQPFFETRVVQGKPKKKRISNGTLLSHIVQGYEAWCLNTVLRGRTDVTCLVFDGWVGGHADVDDLSGVIFDRSIEELGFPIDIQIKAEELV